MNRTLKAAAVTAMSVAMLGTLTTSADATGPKGCEKVHLYAHRGIYYQDMPAGDEGTYGSFKKTAELGGRIETDVWTLNDGKTPVVFHDEWWGRVAKWGTFPLDTRVADTSPEQAKQIRTKTGRVIPNWDLTVKRAVKHWHTDLLVEVKNDPDPATLIAPLIKYNAFDDVTFYTFGGGTDSSQPPNLNHKIAVLRDESQGGDDRVRLGLKLRSNTTGLSKLGVNLVTLSGATTAGQVAAVKRKGITAVSRQVGHKWGAMVKKGFQGLVTEEFAAYDEWCGR